MNIEEKNCSTQEIRENGGQKGPARAEKATSGKSSSAATGGYGRERGGERGRRKGRRRRRRKGRRIDGSSEGRGTQRKGEEERKYEAHLASGVPKDFMNMEFSSGFNCSNLR